MNDIFIGGFDYARGGSDLKNSSKADDFALSIGRVRGLETHFCGAFRHTGITTAQASAILHDYNNRLHLSLLVGDPGGGGLFVRDELRKPIQDDGNRRFPVRPIITKDDTALAGVGNPILCLFKRGDPYIDLDPPDGLGMSWPTDAGPINKAHDVLRTDIEKKLLQAPKVWAGWGKSGNVFSSPNAMRKWLNVQSLSPMDRCRAEIDLTLLQLISVDRETDDEGKPILDKNNFYSFKSKKKKDAAYSLVYMYFGVWMYRQLMASRDSGPEEPQMLITSELINPYADLK